MLKLANKYTVDGPFFKFDYTPHPISFVNDEIK